MNNTQSELLQETRDIVVETRTIMKGVLDELADGKKRFAAIEERINKHEADEATLRASLKELFTDHSQKIATKKAWSDRRVALAMAAGTAVAASAGAAAWTWFMGPHQPTPPK